jgi:acetyltransferase-like isoleucine patch superfamily enzyme
VIHKLADVQSQSIGKNTRIWQYSIVLENAVIGEDCNINCHVFIENNVIVGDRVTIKPGVQIWDGLRIEDDVFVGPNATFVNDKHPRSKNYPESFQKTVLKKGASIGANATILGGIEIGEYAMVGAGSVVTKKVPNRALVVGNPSRIVGWFSENGAKMEKVNELRYKDEKGDFWTQKDQKLIKEK